LHCIDSRGEGSRVKQNRTEQNRVECKEQGFLQERGEGGGVDFVTLL